MDGKTLRTSADGTMRLVLRLDDHPENPREEYDYITHMFDVTDDKAPGPLGDAWAHYRARTSRSRDALNLFVRYAAWVGAHTLVWSPPRDADRVFYLPADKVSEVGDPAACLNAEAEEYQAWAEGDVWGYAIERLVTWQEIDGDRTMETWEHVDSCWGFYGHAYAVEAATEAWEAVTVR